MQWFKRHPTFLREESTKLSNDSNYKERYQVRDNLFVSHGHIIVRLGSVYRYPVVIIYTDATPYQLPLIFPLQEELSEDEVKSLASYSLLEAVAIHLLLKIKFYYDLRHQNSDGSLCIVEFDSLDDGSKFYGITTILTRIRDWYAGHTTGKYPPDNQEVEFSAHFKNVNRNIDFLCPAGFFDESIVAGQFYATLIRQSVADETLIYYGCLIDGVSKGGLYQSGGKYLFTKFIDERLRTSLDFQENSVLVKSYVDRKQLIVGPWFHVDTVLVPFDGFNPLITIIGGGNYEAGVRRIQSVSAAFFSTLHDSFFIGIRFPNKRGIAEFQLFKVYKNEVTEALKFSQDPIEKMKVILSRYERIEAIPSEKVTEENFHVRNTGRANFNILKDKTVHVFGVGALGSEIGDSLGKAGVGSILLVDNQTVRAHNPVRHLAGLSYVGSAKTEAVREIITDHNPFIGAFSWNANLVRNPDIIYALKQDSITISAIADDNVEGLINEHSVIAGKSIFYVRALRGGKVGRIFRVIPGKDACFNCLSLYMQEDRFNLKIPDDTTLPTIKNECNNPVRPASAADLKLISALTSRIVLDHLQHGDSEVNHWIWSTEVLPEVNITSPYMVKSQFIAPHPKCSYCNHDKEITASTDKPVLDHMKTLVVDKKGLETGGVLAGIIGEDDSIHITHASGPGPNAEHQATGFKKDVPFCQKFLDDLYESSSGKVVYVGEWHSHPNENNRPSGLDIKSLSEISSQKEYLLTSPLMIIFSSSGQPSCTVHPAGKRHYFIDLKITA